MACPYRVSRFVIVTSIAESVDIRFDGVFFSPLLLGQCDFQVPGDKGGEEGGGPGKPALSCTAFAALQAADRTHHQRCASRRGRHPP